MQNIVVVGASGGIGLALVNWCARRWANSQIWATYRSAPPAVTAEHAAISWLPLDLAQDESIADFAAALGVATSSVDLLLLCSGWLHDAEHMPEKSLGDLTSTAFARAMRVNAVAPLLLVAQLESLLVRPPGSSEQPSRIMCLSAKVGSISDNGLGGWHAYRMSKAALNMGVQNLGIEFARNKRKPLVVAVHPGTTHSSLSAPFAKSRLPVVAAEVTAARLGELIENLNDEHQGNFLHWDGSPIPF